MLNCDFLGNSSNAETCRSYMNNSGVYYSIKISKCLQSVPYVQQLLSFLSPFFSFTSDYWYYIYHDRNYSDLVVTNVFLKVIFEINNQKMVPFFV